MIQVFAQITHQRLNELHCSNRFAQSDVADAHFATQGRPQVQYMSKLH